MILTKKGSIKTNTHEFMDQLYQILIFLFLSYVPILGPLILHSLANLPMHEIFSSKLF